MQEEIYDLRGKGESDKGKFKKKIREYIKKDLKKYISDESIVVGDGKTNIKVPIKTLEIPEFKFGSPQEGMGTGKASKGDQLEAGNEAGEQYIDQEFSVDELIEMVFEEFGLPNLHQTADSEIKEKKMKWNQVRKVGPMSQIHIKRTIYNNVLKNATSKRGSIVEGIEKDDMRFKAYEVVPEYYTKAVILAMMDISGSMSDEKRYLVRVTLWWIKKYLENFYEDLEFVFVVHDVDAARVDEEKFFTLASMGGTHVSSGLILGHETLEKEYPTSSWNRYAFYFSDGENWSEDNDRAVEALNKIIDSCNMVYYGEVKSNSYATLMKTFQDGVTSENKKRFVCSTIDSRDKVKDAIIKFLDIRKHSTQVSEESEGESDG